MPFASREKGVILVAVLWICALIMWFALQIAAETRLQGEEQIHAIKKSQALFLALGGCYEALARMQGHDQAPAFGEQPSDQNWQPDGISRVVEYETGAAVVIVEPEEEKVNINKAGPEQLNAVFERAGIEDLGVANRLADLILDFVDRDNVPRLHGGEADFYRNLGLNYGPFDAPFTSIDQLLLIPGITQELYYGYERSESDLMLPAKNSLFSLCTIYGNNIKLSQTEDLEEREFGQKAPSWKQGGVYRIYSFGRSSNGPPVAGYCMIVKLGGDARHPYKVLYRRLL